MSKINIKRYLVENEVTSHWVGKDSFHGGVDILLDVERQSGLGHANLGEMLFERIM